MVALAPARLTVPAVASRGLSEVLGRTRNVLPSPRKVCWIGTTKSDEVLAAPCGADTHCHACR